MFNIASEGRQRLPRRGIAGGLGGQSGVSPVGATHAIDPETGQPFCRVSLRDLFVFDNFKWAGVPTRARCHTCDEMTRPPSLVDLTLGRYARAIEASTPTAAPR
jgi:hypothetical protein